MAHNIGNNVQPYIICVACKRENRTTTLPFCIRYNYVRYATVKVIKPSILNTDIIFWHPKWVVAAENTKSWVISFIFGG